jgi:hypothetical protein
MANAIPVHSEPLEKEEEAIKKTVHKEQPEKAPKIFTSTAVSGHIRTSGQRKENYK